MTVRRKVILDTNMLMLPFQFNIDIQKEIERLSGIRELLVPDCVHAELRKLANAQRNPQAKMALQLAERFTRVESRGRGDDAIMELAERMEAMVATNDGALRKLLKKKGIPAIFMRKKNFLEMEGLYYE